MTRQELFNEICTKKSFLCTGIDPEIDKLPLHLPRTTDSILEFNQEIIKYTQQYSVAYKLNTAFFEQYGKQGWEVLEETRKVIPKRIFTIADAKRGDIGNTSAMYAKAFFETLNFDAITVSPYMGEDSLRPFLEFKNKWVIVLALTSNSGAKDFQYFANNGLRLFEKVLDTVSKWGNEDNLMFVTGATKTEEFEQIRKIVPENFLLVPGIGAQGGSLSQVAQKGINQQLGLLVNSSRGIIYAGNEEDYAEKAERAAKFLQNQMEPWVDAVCD
ncbi:MAG: orotidine-5'-phosphate decarboxylase [Bacteroidia bacterium]|nr:orotidine-5'-phosphate decarboxylase [Bacteroidia bacterium]